jgi:two-component system, NtrC family, nitrogen regulation sensor histidine kinase GlnL
MVREDRAMNGVPARRTRPPVADASRILDALTTSVLLLDRGRRVLHLNVAAESLLGVSRNHAKGRSLDEFLRDGAELLALIDRAFERWQAYSRRELGLVPAATAEPLVVDCNVAPFEEVDDAPTLLIELTDATQHQRISRETALLTQIGGSRAMIRQLAHEIKNPLGGLRGAAQLLDRELPHSSMREYTSVIIAEADRLALLVDALLGPGHAPRRESTNIHEVLQHVGYLLAAAAPPTVDIQRDYDPSLPPMLIDRNQIIQAMLNLGRNALQAVASGGRIMLRTRALTNVSIGTRRHRLVASIQFEDDGPGVPDSLRDTVFYPLVTGRDSGTGLGLAVAQDLVSRHDGLIEFRSRPGQTIFTILLPFEAKDAEIP